MWVVQVQSELMTRLARFKSIVDSGYEMPVGSRGGRREFSFSRILLCFVRREVAAARSDSGLASAPNLHAASLPVAAGLLLGLAASMGSLRVVRSVLYGVGV